jgi:hypothetical protein
MPIGSCLHAISCLLRAVSGSALWPRILPRYGGVAIPLVRIPVEIIYCQVIIIAAFTIRISEQNNNPAFTLLI